ncbi:MAG: glycoside hydrolase family 3 C-terminal domain-containing protein [Terracidiphilus sp.]
MLSGSKAFYAGIADMMIGGYGAHPWDAGIVQRLGIEGLKFLDGPRGVVMRGATTFPVSMARGATFDADLEERIGEAIGREVRALGGNLFGGVCINLPRHPAWGRAQETYGEDPEHLACLGAAAVRGVQRYAMACAKHFALNSMENARFRVDVKVSARALHEIYLLHFRRCVDAGVACIMSAYNSVNGEYCGENEALLTGILKKRWGFHGYVITDFIFGLRDGAKALRAGQDVEMPFRNQIANNLKRWVREGKVSIERVDDAVLRILTTQLEFTARPESAIDKKVHAALAREAAAKSIVLLKNDGLLPLVNLKRLAVIGRLAAVANTGDGGSSNTSPDYVVTPLEGLRAALADRCEVLFDDGSDATKAAALAAGCDAAIVVAGYTHADEGEFVSPGNDAVKKFFPRPRLRDLPHLLRIMNKWRKSSTGGFAPGGDRTRLTLRPEDETLILAVAQANSRTAVAVMAGSTVLMEAWRERAAAILMLWYPGQEGGHAFADVLTGRVNPSGRLPFVVPIDATHLPYFDKDATSIVYDLWHGYRKLDRDGHVPAFPYGFGLSYTSFAYRNFTAMREGDVLKLKLTVANTGARDGDDVVQIYARALNSQVERAVRELKAFTRVSVAAGASTDVSIDLPIERLAYFDENRDEFVVEPLVYEFIAARHSHDGAAPSVSVRLP